MIQRSDKIIGVILAAGKGTRIYPFSETIPKPILPVCNRPLLEFQVDIMGKHGISEIIVVMGYCGYQIVVALGDGSRQGVSIRYVEQKENLGLAHALGKLESYIDTPFILFLGDIYFVTDDLGPLMDEVISGEINANLASKFEPDSEMIKRNFAIVADETGRVRQVIEKPHFVESQIKGCGLYIFDQRIFDAIRRTPRTAMRDEYEITDSIQIMINDGHTVCHRSVVTYDMNLTVPEDLLKINLAELSRQERNNVTGTDIDMPSGTRLENSVIGDGVTFSHPIKMSNSLVFSNSLVPFNTDTDGVIVHSEKIIYCNSFGGD